MKVSAGVSIWILSLCSTTTALVLADARADALAGLSPEDLWAVYTEEEHVVHVPHPHFRSFRKRDDGSEASLNPGNNVVHQINFDTNHVFRDPGTCGVRSGGTFFNWITLNEYYYKMNRHETDITEVRLWGGERVNRIQVTYNTALSPGTAGKGGTEVPNSPLRLSYDRSYISGLVSSCCSAHGSLRTCFLQVQTNLGGERNTLQAGVRGPRWRTSSPACCRLVNFYGAAGDEIDSLNGWWLITHAYALSNRPRPGWPGQAMRRRALDAVGTQSEHRASSTPLLGHVSHDNRVLPHHAAIDHSEHLRDHFRLARVVTYSTDRVEGIGLYYHDLLDPSNVRPADFHGRRVGQLREMLLEPGDYVTGLDNSPCLAPGSAVPDAANVHAKRSQVCGLVFHTYLMVNPSIPSPFLWTVMLTIHSKDMRLVDRRNGDNIRPWVGTTHS